MKICKLIAVLLFSLPFCAPFSASEDVVCLKPTLLVLSSPACQPCNDFKAAHDAPDPAFRKWLQVVFRFKAEDVVDINSAKGQRLSKWYGVNRVPTFLVLNPLGVVLNRTEGFTTATQFAREIMPGAKHGQEQERAAPQAAPAPQVDAITERLKQANESLQRKAEAADLKAREAEAKLIEQREAFSRANQGRQADASTLESLAEANNILQGKAEELARVAKQAEAQLQAQAERFRKHIQEQASKRKEDEHENIEYPPEELPAESNKPGESVFGAIVKTGVSLALSLGLSQIQSEVLVPFAVLAGPAGLAGLAAFKIFAAMQKPKKPALIAPAELPQTPPEFDLTTLPFQDVDYTSTWADHWVREGKSPELAAQEYSHFVNAFLAVGKGELKLPGIEDGATFARQVRNWVARQFRAYTSKQVDNNNPNHRAFYAFLHKQAFENIRNGKFNEAAPNPKAADVLEDWVNEKIVGELVFNPNK